MNSVNADDSVSSEGPSITPNPGLSARAIAQASAGCPIPVSATSSRPGALRSRVDRPTVARWLGHREGVALLARTYFHLVDEHSRLLAQKVRIAV